MQDITQNMIGNALVNLNNSKLQSSDMKMAIKNGKEIERVAEDFEAVFITQMVQFMFKDVETDDLFGGGHGEDVFKTLLFDEYGKAISKAGGVGVAANVQRELINIQAAQN